MITLADELKSFVRTRRTQKPMKHSDELGTNETAKALGVTVKTLEKWRWRCHGPKFTKRRVNGRWFVFYRQRDVEAWKP